MIVMAVHCTLLSVAMSLLHRTLLQLWEESPPLMCWQQFACTFLWSKGTVQVFTRIPKFFVPGLLPWSSPQHVVVSEVVQVQNFAILLAELPDVPINLFFQPVKFALDSGMFLWPVITPSSFVSSANLLRVHFAPPSTSSVEMLNKTEPVWISGVQ